MFHTITQIHTAIRHAHRLAATSLLLCCLLCLSSCADNSFFQKDAQATPEEVKGRAPAGPDSAWVIAGRHYDRSGVHRFFWGDHHRQVWTTPVKVPVLKLNAVNGGLKVLKKGGGFQTTSFTLEDSTGRLYALRSLDKDPVDVVSPFWRKTFVANILRDQTSAANPYGVLVLPILAEAAGVYHASSKLFYVPSSANGFGAHATAVGGRVFMLQDKFETPDDLSPAFKGVDDFADTDAALKNRFSCNNYHFDQKAFARARLLDVLVGDWDRHKGQWEWALKKNGTEYTYYPIPKDRDQVFLKMNDGLIPAIATSKFVVRKFHSFEEKFDDVPAYMINGAFVDARFLNELSLSDFTAIARDMQQRLTDAVIQKAVQQLPPPVFNLIGAELLSKLKSRRDLLPEAAKKMYKKLAKEVTVVGSDEAEEFIVKRLDDDRTEVIMQRPAQDGLQGRVLYRRVFNRSETEEITLHGLGGDDTFIVQGKVRNGLLLKLYGGIGEDTYKDTSEVDGWKHLTRIYDTARGNNLQLGPESKDRTTRDVRVHAYDREGK
ncbi:hypothetical protein ACXYMU_14525 [Pontibacter sp. CAU 1760]